MKRRDDIKCRRGGEAEDTREIICAGFVEEAPGNLLPDLCAAIRLFSGIVGVRNAPILCKSQDVVLEFVEALQQTFEYINDYISLKFVSTSIISFISKLRPSIRITFPSTATTCLMTIRSVL